MTNHALAVCIGFPILSLIGCGGDEFTARNAEGTGGASASTGGTGPDTDSPCGAVPITFRLRTTEPDRNCVPDESCQQPWVTVREASAPEATGPLAMTTGCALPCSTCEAPSCLEAPCLYKPFEDEVSLAWDGSVFTADTCGGGSSCLAPTCAPPGQYIAEFCLPRAEPGVSTEATCMPNDTVECRRVEFMWPEDREVLAEIGSQPGP